MEPLNSPLQGRVAVVTGGGAGIGRASALALAAQGAAVIVVDIDGMAAQIVAREIAAVGGHATAVAADVSSATGAAQVVETARGLGGLDILHNNAGIQRYGTVVDTTEEEWDEVLRVNLKSVYLVSHACVPLILERGGGAIINTASVQAFISQAGVAAYTASKHAVLGLTRSMAVDLAPSIRVNCVCPGAVDTPMLRTALAGAADPAATRRILERQHPLGRVARPEEVGSVVAFLAGPGAAFITGAAVPVDGGVLVRVGGSPVE